MESVIFDPLEQYENRYQALHAENVSRRFTELVQASGVDAEENRKTVALYTRSQEDAARLKKRLRLLRFLRVVMLLTVLLIPLVLWKITPTIRALRQELQTAGTRTQELLMQAYRQMQPLNRMFTDRDALQLIQETVPQIVFYPCFSARQDAEMRTNFDFREEAAEQQSALEVLSGTYNDNPFLFENRVQHRMGTQTYYGYKTIYWTETYTDNEGHVQTRSCSQTLQASVVKPKPFYRTQVVLYYGSQGGPELCFYRDATHLEKKSPKEIEKYVRKGEKRLRKKTEHAMERGENFEAMTNSDFEVLFDALNRNHEVQFRTLFTPLAQTNMVRLLLSRTGYGDDFCFTKQKRMNRIESQHSQGRPINLLPAAYTSYSFDMIRDNFERKNREFFRQVYFDFAPLLAIPAYQERPVHSLKPVPDTARLCSDKECEVLANAVDRSLLVHPDTKTQAILKTEFVRSEAGKDVTRITAHSYDVVPHVTHVSVHGDDGAWHDVAVKWDEYVPLEASGLFCIVGGEQAAAHTMARRDGLGIVRAENTDSKG